MTTKTKGAAEGANESGADGSGSNVGGNESGADGSSEDDTESESDADGSADGADSEDDDGDAEDDGKSKAKPKAKPKAVEINPEDPKVKAIVERRVKAEVRKAMAEQTKAAEKAAERAKMEEKDRIAAERADLERERDEARQQLEEMREAGTFSEALLDSDLRPQDADAKDMIRKLAKAEIEADEDLEWADAIAKVAEAKPYLFKKQPRRAAKNEADDDAEDGDEEQGKRAAPKRRPVNGTRPANAPPPVKKASDMGPEEWKAHLKKLGLRPR
jgi:hypothetical protein